MTATHSPVTRSVQMSSETSKHRRTVFWVAIPVVCLATAVAGAVLVRTSARPAAATPLASDRAKVAEADHAGDEIGALRAEVRRLGVLVGAMAAAMPSAAAAPPAEAPQPSKLAVPLPATETPSRDDVIARYEAAPPNSMKTRTVASSLNELVKKESLSASQLKVDEVDCRGDSCRVRVSFTEDAPAQSIAMELAGLLPDSHSFQEAAPGANNRRVMISHYIDDAGNVRH